MSNVEYSHVAQTSQCSYLTLLTAALTPVWQNPYANMPSLVFISCPPHACSGISSSRSFVKVTQYPRPQRYDWRERALDWRKRWAHACCKHTALQLSTYNTTSLWHICNSEVSATDTAMIFMINAIILHILCQYWVIIFSSLLIILLHNVMKWTGSAISKASDLQARDWRFDSRPYITAHHLGQVIHTHESLSASSIIWFLHSGSDAVWLESNHGPSRGTSWQLITRIMNHITSVLTA